MMQAVMSTPLGYQCRRSISSRNSTSTKSKPVQCTRWQPSLGCLPPAAGQKRLIAARSTFSSVEGGESAAPSPVAAKAMAEYFELERSGQVTSDSLANLRLKYGMRRGIDGRVQLRRRDGVWMQCKLDMEIKGTMLLRDTANSHIHILMTDRLEQLDLSDDYLLMMLFADGLWEAQTQPIQLGDGNDVEVLQLEEQQFKDFVGVIKTLQELEATEEADGTAAEPSNSSSRSFVSSINMDGPEIDVKAEPVNGR